MSQALDMPVFDGDNHLYETEDALTRHLPSEHENLFRFVELNGRKKLAVRSTLKEYLNTWEGVTGEFVPFRPRAFAAVADAGRMIHDSFASAICHGMLSRFPGVRLISVESGGSWVGHLLRNLESAWKKMPNEFSEHPVEVFERNVWVNPFREDSLDGRIDLLGPDRTCFGSDYPHPEDLDDPLGWVRHLSGLDARSVRRIMSANLFDLLELPEPVGVTGQ